MAVANVHPGNSWVTFSLMNGPSNPSGGKMISFYDGTLDMFLSLNSADNPFGSTFKDNITGGAFPFNNNYPYKIPVNATTKYSILLDGGTVLFKEVGGAEVLNISHPAFASIDQITFSPGGGVSVLNLVVNYYILERMFDIEQFQNNVYIQFESEKETIEDTPDNYLEIDFTNPVDHPDDSIQLVLYHDDTNPLSLLKLDIDGTLYEIDIPQSMDLINFPDLSLAIHDDIFVQELDNGGKSGTVIGWAEGETDPIFVEKLRNFIRSITHVVFIYRTNLLDFTIRDPQLFHTTILPNKTIIVVDHTHQSIPTPSDFEIQFSFFQKSFDYRIEFTIENETSVEDSTITIYENGSVKSSEIIPFKPSEYLLYQFIVYNNQIELRDMTNDVVLYVIDDDKISPMDKFDFYLDDDLSTLLLISNEEYFESESSSFSSSSVESSSEFESSSQNTTSSEFESSSHNATTSEEPKKKQQYPRYHHFSHFIFIVIVCNCDRNRLLYEKSKAKTNSLKSKINKRVFSFCPLYSTMFMMRWSIDTINFQRFVSNVCDIMPISRWY